MRIDATIPESDATVLSELPLENVIVDDPFWNRRINRNRTVTLEHQYRLLHETGRVDNFRKAAGRMSGSFQGTVFNDSDVYKWIEAASYAYAASARDASLAAKIEELVEITEAAQKKDGYLNTYFTLTEPEKKWTNLGMMHELYCAGHLFQAAVANHRATGSTRLLNVARAFADNIDRTFRTEGRMGAPGHAEIELALIELYEVTGEGRYLELSSLFLNRRGTDETTFRRELSQLDEIAGYGLVGEVDNFDALPMDEFYRKFYLAPDGSYDGSYTQDRCSLREQSTVEGHAVRAMYLYSAMADVAALTGEQALQEASLRLWRDMTEKRMYVTGGIGGDARIEGFGEDYDLPNAAAYAETCAAVGSIMWNHRLLKLTREGRFGDLMELVLYNALLAGVSLSGDRFFYVNPLESDGAHHRKGWFNVSCCPMNAARLIASLQRYAYLRAEEALYVNLYISGEVTVEESQGRTLRFSQRSQFPWNGKTTIAVTAERPERLRLHLRLPAWQRGYRLQLNGVAIEEQEQTFWLEKGFLVIEREWRDGDRLVAEFDMEIERLIAHPDVADSFGAVALRRGPLMYCLEQTDHDTPLHQLVLWEEARLRARHIGDLLDGCTVIEGDAWRPARVGWDGVLYRNDRDASYEPTRFRAIPYHLWDNREAGAMRVWMRAAWSPFRAE